MKNILSITLSLALLVLVTSFDVGAMDGPHADPTKVVNTSCTSCHNSSLPSDSITFNSNCLSCHSDFYTGTNSAAKLTSHRWTGNVTNPAAGAQSPTTGALSQVQIYTGDQLACVNCHNPHVNGNGKYQRIANGTDQLCLDCHRARNTQTAAAGSHPVLIGYSSAAKATPDKFVGKVPVNANPANPTSDLGAKLSNDGRLLCSTCHGVHSADSRSDNYEVVNGVGQKVFDKEGDGNLLRTNPRGDKVASGLTDKRNICTNCHAGKTNHNGKGQDVQCIDCHGAHVEYDPNDPTNTKGTNINLIRRNLPGTSNQILFRYTGDNREYKNAAGTGVCQGCHTVPSSIAQHTSNDPNVCNTCHTHNSSKGAFTASCDSCHGYPPITTASGAAHPNNTNCGLCHNTDPSVHMNGTVDVSTNCNACHGNPPAYANGTPKTNSHSTTGHMVGCNTCHAGTTSTGTTITNTTLHMDGAYSLQAGSGVSFTYTYASTGGTCSSISCHGNTAATWGSTAACTTCHGNPPPNAVGSYTGVNEVTSPHTKHAGKGVNYSYACSECHKGNTHGNGSFQDVFIDKSGIIAGSTATYATATRTCSSLYCHSNGTSVATGQAASGSVVWSSDKLTCNGCHSYPPAYVNNTVKANNHLSHNFGCGTCHATTTTDSFAISDNTKHVNGAYDVTPGTGTTFTYTYAANGGTCSNINCHQGVNAKWGSNVNHIANFGSGTAGFDLSNSHDYALSDSAPCATCHYANIVVQHNNDCSICHAGANPAGSLIGSWNKTCESCHSSPHPSSVNHDSELGRCDTCHSDGGGSFYGCTECHSPSDTLASYINNHPLAYDSPPSAIKGNLKLLVHMDEPAWIGTPNEVRDSSGWNSHGTAANGATTVAGGVTNRAGSFNVVNSSVTMKYPVGVRPTNTFTVEAWVKPAATHEIDTESTSGYAGTSGQKYLFWPDHRGDYDGGAGVSVGTNGVAVYEHGSSYMPALAVFSGPISSSQWTHIAVVYENKRPSIYVNGALVRTGLQSQRQFVYAPQTIGSGDYGYYSGLTDEVAIYDSALTGTEILQHALQLCTATSNTAVSIRWTSAIISSSYVDYGLTTSYGTTLGNETLVNTHTLALPGLADNTTYHYRTRSTTAAGVETVSGDNTVTTGSCAPITTPPAVPTGISATAGVGQMTISWTSGTGASSSLIRYGTTSGNLSTTIDPASLPQTITGLIGGTTYYYQVGAKNSAGTIWDSTVYTVTPVAPSAPIVISPTATSIAINTAILGANVSSNGGVAITVKGTCWGLAGSPATNCVVQGTTAAGIFTQSRTGLTEGSLIYYRGYATNSAGTGYSPDGTIYTEPVQPNTLTFNNVGSNGITVNWATGSTGNAKNVIVLMKAGTAATANPADGTTYTANAAFGGGTQIGSTGYYVVYKGAGTSVAVTGLTASSTYQVKIYAFAAGTSGTENYNLTSPLAGSQGTSSTLTVPTLTSPTATSIGSTTATLGANVTSIGGAAITARGTVWGTSPSPTVNSVAAVGTTTGVFTHARSPITAGTKIYYRGFATNSGGTGYSPDGSFYTEPSIQAASVNITSVSSTGMTVNWTRGDGDGVIVLMKQGSAVNSDPVDGTYTGYVANSVFTSGTQIGTGNYVIYKGAGTSAVITGLTSGTAYYVAVYEFKSTLDTSGVNQGTNYKPVAATGSQTTVSAPPVAPLVLSPVTGDGQVTISWTAGTGSTSSLIKYGTASGVYSTTIDPATSPSTFTGLTNGIPIFYQVGARNASGTAWSAEYSVTPAASLTMTFPITHHTGVTLGGVYPDAGDIIWAGPFDYADIDRSFVMFDTSSLGAGATITSAKLYLDYKNRDYMDDDGITGIYESAWEYPGDLNTFNDVGVKLASNPVSTSQSFGLTAFGIRPDYVNRIGVTKFAIRADNEDYESYNSDVGYSRATSYLEITYASAVQAPSTPTAISAVAGNTQATITWTIGANAASSLIKYGTVTGVYGAPIDPVTSPRTIAGLTNGTTIYYQVGAKNAAGTTWSTEYNVTPVGLPSAPTAITSSAGNTQTTISWTAGIGSTSSNIRYGTASGTYPNLLAAVTTPRIITGLINGTTYYYQVGAVNGSGTTWSAELSVTPVPLAPSTPTGVSAVAASGQATISWTDGTGATSSLIRYGTVTGVYPSIIDPATSPRIISGLTNGTAIYYQVGATNAAGTTWSAEHSVTPVAPGSQTWTTPGTYYFTVPAGVTAVTLLVKGGGGGGGLEDNVNNQSGGANGDLVAKVITGLTPESILKVVVAGGGNIDNTIYQVGAGGSGYHNGASGGDGQGDDPAWSYGGAGGGGSSAIMLFSTSSLLAEAGGGAGGRSSDYDDSENWYGDGGYYTGGAGGAGGGSDYPAVTTPGGGGAGGGYGQAGANGSVSISY